MDGTINTQSNQVNHVKLTHNTTVIRSCSYYYNKIKKLHTNTTVTYTVFYLCLLTPLQLTTTATNPHPTEQEGVPLLSQKMNEVLSMLSSVSVSHHIPLSYCLWFDRIIPFYTKIQSQ